MGTKVYANCSIGPSVKVGGEINNVVFFGNSNKGHDGFLGNAVIGEWCNIGAGTDASNLKNDYGLVRVWDYASGNFAKTDLQFCGLLMGDHPNVQFKPLLIRLRLWGLVATYLVMDFHVSLSPVFQEEAHRVSPKTDWKKSLKLQKQ